MNRELVNSLHPRKPKSFLRESMFAHLIMFAESQPWRGPILLNTAMSEGRKNRFYLHTITGNIDYFNIYTGYFISRY